MVSWFGSVIDQTRDCSSHVVVYLQVLKSEGTAGTIREFEFPIFGCPVATEPICLESAGAAVNHTVSDIGFREWEPPSRFK